MKVIKQLMCGKRNTGHRWMKSLIQGWDFKESCHYICLDCGEEKQLTQQETVTEICYNCIKRGQMECPNSFYCYSRADKPHYDVKSVDDIKFQNRWKP